MYFLQQSTEEQRNANSWFHYVADTYVSLQSYSQYLKI